MPRIVKLRERRAELLYVCEEIIESLISVEAGLTMVSQAVEASVEAVAEATVSGATLSQPTTAGLATVHGVTVPRVRWAVHSILIAEWQIYLGDVFEIAVQRQLKPGKTMPDLGRLKIVSESLDTRTLAAARESLARAMKDGFNWLEYAPKLDTLAKFFPSLKRTEGTSRTQKTEQDRHKETLRQHVIIRHMFQHSRGRVRRYDLDRLGGRLCLHDEDGNEREYREGEQAELSPIDIRVLGEAIENFSSHFEELP